MNVQINQKEKRSWVDVDLAQIRSNFHIFKQNIPDEINVIVVIKADAYGHGDIKVAKTLEKEGVSCFAVSNIDEAVGLRQSGVKCDILLLGYTSVKYAKTIYDNDLTQTIVSDEYAASIANTGYKIKCHFAIDTGMNRIGLDGKNTQSCERTIRKYYKSLNITGIFTHLCVADSTNPKDVEYTKLQIQLFSKLTKSLDDLNLKYIHCCNSAGALYHFSDAAYSNWVRLGIVLYGLKPDSLSIIPEGIKPALSWKSTVSLVKDVQKGETVGYGRAYLVERNMRIATVTTGYADGLRRDFSTNGFVLINGQIAPIVGRICMDQTMVDVTGIPNVHMGTIVTILGTDCNYSFNADNMGKLLGTIGYEVVCGISKRVQRFYINE